ncbi:hypothetical protein C5S29_02785 [ANME-1 cluster archaeon GoMg3.2]|nr:hypothetical protein [ANME-1 cluster archaeon GoMg3.2]
MKDGEYVVSIILVVILVLCFVGIASEDMMCGC